MKIEHDREQVAAKALHAGLDNVEERRETHKREGSPKLKIAKQQKQSDTLVNRMDKSSFTGEAIFALQTVHTNSELTVV
jgi:hypothetical protein